TSSLAQLSPTRSRPSTTPTLHSRASPLVGGTALHRHLPVKVRAVPTRGDAKERILRGALQALALYGSRRFSMSLVADESGVSRATMYRYFPTKESLLDALTGHIGSEFRSFLAQEIRDARPDQDMVALVVATMHRYTVQTPVLTQLLGAEPLFVRSFYR